MSLRIGDNVLDGRAIIVTVSDGGGVRATFPWWVDPINNRAQYVEVTTLEILLPVVIAMLENAPPS